VLRLLLAAEEQRQAGGRRRQPHGADHPDGVLMPPVITFAAIAPSWFLCNFHSHFLFPQTLLIGQAPVASFHVVLN
jgi:hypothetical protein